MKLIRIAFLKKYKESWMGGVNYFKNLFYAISTIKDIQIEHVLFIGKKTDYKTVCMHEPYVTIIRNSIFDSRSVKGIIIRIIYNLTGRFIFYNKLFKKHKIDIVSHSNIYGNNIKCKTINWIPDFQHTMLPDMFPKKTIVKRNKLLKKIIKYSTAIIVSSNASCNDLKKNIPEYIDKVKILSFVSRPDKNMYLTDAFLQQKKIKEKYMIPTKYFYLPNQFWKHKNHMVVFKAVKILKDKGVEIFVVCTGGLNDYRNQDYLNNLYNYLSKHNLNDNIKILGLIDYKYVMYFYRNAVSVINPSLFEGWSSTVEEVKSIGKNIILSNLEVHREQYPPGGVFFNPHDHNELSEILESKWKNSEGGPDYDLEKKAKIILKRRIKRFGENYQKIVHEVYNNYKSPLYEK